MKSMLTSMAVVLTFCAAPAASAEFPKTGEAEYDTYYVFNTLAEIDSGAGKGAIVDITGITRKNRCTGNRTVGSNPTLSDQLVHCFCREIRLAAITAKYPQVTLTKFGKKRLQRTKSSIVGAPYTADSPFPNSAVRLGSASTLAG